MIVPHLFSNKMNSTSILVSDKIIYLNFKEPHHWYFLRAEVFSMEKSYILDSVPCRTVEGIFEVVGRDDLLGW